MSDRDNHPTLDVDMLNELMDNGTLSIWNLEEDVQVRVVELSEDQNEDGPLKYTVTGFRFRLSPESIMGDIEGQRFIEEEVTADYTIYEFRDTFAMYQKLEANF